MRPQGRRMEPSRRGTRSLKPIPPPRLVSLGLAVLTCMNSKDRYKLTVQESARRGGRFRAAWTHGHSAQSASVATSGVRSKIEQYRSTQSTLTRGGLLSSASTSSTPPGPRARRFHHGSRSIFTIGVLCAKRAGSVSSRTNAARWSAGRALKVWTALETGRCVSYQAFGLILMNPDRLSLV